MQKYVLWYEQLGMNDVEVVGGKNASLGEMIQVTKSLGIKVPKGFALTTSAYQEFLEANNLIDFIIILNNIVF